MILSAGAACPMTTGPSVKLAPHSARRIREAAALGANCWDRLCNLFVQNPVRGITHRTVAVGENKSFGTNRKLFATRKIEQGALFSLSHARHSGK
jgi:hypothetical protein